MATNFFVEVNINHEILPKIYGSFDVNIKKIEKEFNVLTVIRNEKIKIIGEKANCLLAKELIEILIDKANKGNDITEQDLNYCMDIVENIKINKNDVIQLDDEVLSRTIQGKPIKPKTIGQKNYVDSIKNNMITFGIGPAGTGKTYLGMCMAIEAFKRGEVTKLILTRPAIEAGEKLGFLPGDLQSKIDPYLRPLYDALYQIMGAESFQSNMEKGLIEVAPLAYMRGRTLDNAFIILDEAQNTTIPQMKMFLTRIGFNSKVIVTGDDTQKDLPRDVMSGLDSAVKVLKNIDGISFIRLTSKDVVRHPLVQKIVMAYENYDKKKKK
ncbi:MAG: PhoH family protein [Lachnospiraceae bacterium]|nr:PhoH family protein [Lachnospiraceae bacterium]